MPSILGNNTAVGEEDCIKVLEKCSFHDIMGDQAGARTATMVCHTAIQVPFGPDAKKVILEDIIAIEISKDV
jgi:hypothetical protein